MKEKITMDVMNPHAAGIDVGSKSHYVAVGQQENDVKEFGVYTQDHEQLIEHLHKRKITSIAMESTGSYWQTLFAALQGAGFEVLLANGRQIKNMKGKTDVKDCMWIQKLHSMGLLTGSFLPSKHIEQIRTYHRHRGSLVEQASKMSNKMQKTLRLMNVRLDIIINDIMGKSGRAIIEAILEGARDGENLASLADPRVRKSKKEITQALQGQWQDELLYELKDCYELYNTFQKKIKGCDEQIEQMLKKNLKQNTQEESPLPPLSKKQLGKNHPKFDLPALSYRYTGVDLFAIEGMSFNTIMTYLAEVGTDIYKFKTAKQFASWLRLAPNNKVSGNKLISSRTPKGKNKLAQALRNAANAVDRLKSGTLVSFFKRIAYKKGRAAAITATARKMAIILWNMVVKQISYQPMDVKIYNEKIKNQMILNIKNKMKRMNILINDLQPTCRIS